MVSPCREPEHRCARIDVSDHATDGSQHRAFRLRPIGADMQRHCALVALSERHVHMRERMRIAERVVDRRDDPNHSERLFRV